MACSCISGYCNNRPCSGYVAACGANAYSFPCMNVGDLIAESHIQNFQDSIDNDNTGRRGWAAVGWSYDPNVGDTILAAHYNEISNYLNNTWLRSVAPQTINVGDIIQASRMSNIQAQVNAGRAACWCNAHCSCDINCSCFANCGCKYA